MNAIEILGQPEAERRIRNYLKTLRRRKTHVPAGHLLMCAGGPYHGQEMRVRNTPWQDVAATAIFRVRDWHGRYLFKEGADYDHLEWEDQP